MTTDFVEDQISVSAPEPETTRWEARPVDLAVTSEPRERERGGIILAAFVALLLPLIVAGVILLPGASSSETDSTSNELESIGLDGIAVTPTTATTPTVNPGRGADTSSPVAGVVETEGPEVTAHEPTGESAVEAATEIEATVSVSGTNCQPAW